MAASATAVSHYTQAEILPRLRPSTHSPAGGRHVGATADRQTIGLSTLMMRTFESESIERLQQIFEAARSDVSTLTRLEAELQQRPDNSSRLLRLKVIAARMSAQKATTARTEGAKPVTSASEPARPAAVPPPALRPLQVLLTSFGLTLPDRRPLHAYKLSAAAYQDLESVLVSAAKAGRLARYNREDAALFVRWAAEWFRRHYDGGIRKYEDLGRVLGVRFEQAHWRALVDEGLAWWRRPVIQRASGGHRLLTLALEGGFPTRVLEDKERSWLVRYLVGLVSTLLAVPDVTSEGARDLAWTRRTELRETYQYEEFCFLAADLAFSVIRLRKEAAQASLDMPGLSPSAVLDAVRPDWRADLSIASEGEAARRLIDGMMSAPMQTTSGGAISTTRQLIFKDDRWYPAVRLGLSGEIAAKDLANFRSGDGRIRVFPHGALGRVVGRELAVLDPPSDVDGSWLLRPMIKVADILGMSLSSPVEVSLQAVGRAALTLRWPRGHAVAGDILSFAIDSETDGRPTRLTLIAEGTARVRPERIVVAAPIGWRIDANGTDTVSLGLLDDSKELWLTDGALVVVSPDEGLAYRVEPGAAETTSYKLAFAGPSPAGLKSEGEDTLLFAGAPTVSCVRGALRGRPASDEVYWRSSPQEPWRDITKARLPVGLVDVSWKDAQSGFIFDRQRVGILPEGAGVGVKAGENNTAEYAFAAIRPLNISVAAAPGLSGSVSGTTASLRFTGKPRRTVSFQLRSAERAKPIVAAALFPNAGGIARPDGELVEPGSTLTPATLETLTAFGQGRQAVTIHSSERRSQGRETARIAFEDEMPLRGVADDLDRALRASGSIDATFLIEFSTSRRTQYHVKWFDCSLEIREEHISVHSIPGLMDQAFSLVGRPVEEPFTETLIANVTVSDMLNRRWFRLPDECRGTWLVYLRTGHTIRSRPVLVVAEGKHIANGRGLALASTETSIERRRRAFAAEIKGIEESTGNAFENLNWLRSLICSLDGLPVVTFDALKELAHHPETLARLLLSSREAEQSPIWSLEAELPFLWSAIPVECWQRAGEATASAIELQLAGTGLASAARDLATSSLGEAAQRVRTLDPALDAALSAAGLGTAPIAIPPANLRDVAADYIRRTVDRDEPRVLKKTSLFRIGALDRLLPNDFAKFDPQHLETLDAPCAAALAAAGRAKLSPEQLAVCKESVTSDPMYWAQAYTVILHRALSTDRQ